MARRSARLPWLFVLATGCSLDAVVGELPPAPGDPADLTVDLVDARLDPPDLRPPPDLSLCAPGKLAFGAQLDTPTMEAYGRGPTIADFDGDGLLDAALPGGATVAGSSYALLLRGAGDGSFRISGLVQTLFSIVDVASADFDGDGIVDLAMAAQTPGSDALAAVVTVLDVGLSGIPRRKITFAPGKGVALQLAGGDLDGDGRPDLVLSTRDPGGGANLFALLGGGDGSFRTASSLVSPSDAIAVADLDGDGRLDLASVEGGTRTLHLFAGDGKGGFTRAADLALDPGLGTRAIVAADLDGDGRLDLAIPNYKDGAGGVSLLLGDGGWRFRARSFAALGGPLSLAAADLDGDGHLDLVAADNQAPTLEVWSGHGDGTFGDPRVLRIGTEPIGGVAVGLIDADCRPDLLVGRGAQYLTTVLNASR